MNPHDKYRQTHIGTASQGKLLLMLYDGALKFLTLAEEGIQDTDIEKSHKYLIKTQDIIVELMVTLDLEKGGQVAQNLMSLYSFLKGHLVKANLEKDLDKVIEARNIMAELREAWAVAVRKHEGNEDISSSAEMNISPPVKRLNIQG